MALLRRFYLVFFAVLATSFGVHAGKTISLDAKALAATDLSFEQALTFARSDSRQIDKALTKVFRSKESDEILGALNLVNALGATNHLKSVVKMLDHEDDKIARSARYVLVNLPGDKASKAVVQEWRRLEKMKSDALSNYADMLVGAPLNVATFDWLNDQSSEFALSSCKRLEEHYGLSSWDLETIKQVALCSKQCAKKGVDAPLFLSSQYATLPRYAKNVQLGVRQVLEFDLMTGIELDEKQGIEWRIWLLLCGDEPLVRIDVRDERGWGFEFQLEKDSYAALGSQTQRVVNDMEKRWVEVVFAWMPYEESAVSNFYCTIDGKMGFETSRQARWTSTRMPEMKLAVEEEAVVVSDGGLSEIDRLPS